MSADAPATTRQPGSEPRLVGHEYAVLDPVPPTVRIFGLADQAALWFAATCLPAAWFHGALR